MIKYVSSVVVLSTLLVGCGGSDNDDKKPPKSSSAMSSSAPASSSPASSAPASSAAPSSVAPSSVATSSSSSSGPVVINAEMTTDAWRGNNGGTVSGSNLGITLLATANAHGAVFDVEPMNLYNAVLEMVVNVSPEFKASGAKLQPFAQIKNVWTGKWCDIENAAFNASEDYVATCLLDEAVLNQTVNGLQVGVQASGTNATTPTGVVTIKSAKITLASAPANSSSSSSSSSAASNPLVDFEADAAGTTYGGIAWAPTNITATVETIASITGLPANGTSTKVLKISVTDYNSAPMFSVTVPSGKTLADYNLKVDAYFPRNSLGLTDAGGNHFKSFFFLADTALTGASTDSNAAYQSKIETDADDVDAWQTFTFTPDATKAAALTGNIQVSVGISRPATTNDAYYLDNLRLEPK